MSSFRKYFAIKDSNTQHPLSKSSTESKVLGKALLSLSNWFVFFPVVRTLESLFLHWLLGSQIQICGPHSATSTRLKEYRLLTN